MTLEERSQACDALKAWFQSQGLTPADCMMTIELFIAYMILSNAANGGSIEDKIKMIINSIEANIAVVCLAKGLR